MGSQTLQLMIRWLLSRHAPTPHLGGSVQKAALFSISAVVVSVFVAGTAHAQTTSEVNPELAVALQARLGDRSPGAYHDATGRLVVTVTDNAAAETVRAAGAKARVVTRSAADLRAATGQLDRTAAVPGTAWQVDPATNQVLV